MATLAEQRQKEFLGGVVHLLTIDASELSGSPSHILRLVNSYGQDGQGVIYQGNTFKPHPYEIAKVSKNQKASKTGSRLLISDNDDFEITRFIENVGGNLDGAKILEIKVFGRFLDNGIDPNIYNYSKRLDHLINYVEDSDKKGELIVHTIDPLSKDIKVPSLTFSAGIPNSDESIINVFPAVDRSISRDR